MIEFLTLFLGLATGPQTVELSAGSDTASVQLLLDGVPVATDEAAPWKLEVDLGTTLQPHLLEAVALDGSGEAIARTSQRINLPRPPAEVRIVLERSEGGGAHAARLSWESSIRRDPVRSRAWLDGVALDVSDPGRIPLPAHDPSRLHVLQVELEFSADVLAEANLAFGGAYLDQASADLTALPVFAPGKSRKAKPGEMGGWFSVSDRPVRVVGFDKGGLDLLLVRGPGVAEAIGALPGTLDQPVYSGGLTTPGVGGPTDFGNVAGTGVASVDDRLQRILTLDQDQRLRLLLPHARRQAGRSVEMEVFALSPAITSEQGGLYWALQQEFALPGLVEPVRLADAVAVAGLQAANGNRRRAVLLLLAEEVSDESRHDAAEVRRYLNLLRVPLVVWRIGEEIGPVGRPWGEGEEVATFQELKRAARDLSDGLDAQRIVWLEGRHLPGDIRISSTAKVRPVGP